MAYRPPVADMVAAMRHAAALDEGIADGLYAALGDGLAESVLEEAARFAADRIAPLDAVGDRTGARFAEGRVTMPPGWKEAYQDWCAAGWNALPGPAEHGGQGLPTLLNAACVEMWNGASMAFGIGPVLSMGAVEALESHGSEDLKHRYLDKLVSGEWTGTMNLTEPQAGSDLAALRTRATPAGDGTYRISGSKIFITYGEHDLADNIVHLVLARLPDAPAGTRGISLFLVPKRPVEDDGALGPENDVACAGIEHKLGIHASPTCTMVYGEKNGGAVGWLIGEENRGLACMFTMMNNARLSVGLQGVGIAERALQKAEDYAAERRQGRPPGAPEGAPIAAHPDVKRMLGEMRAKTAAARAICYALAGAIDRGRAGDGAAAGRAALLTPIAKAFATDIGSEVASLGIQVHGGMGYVEETGAARFYRDARITAIYEGTNGIQAIDLATRKLPLEGGAPVRREIAAMRGTVERLAGRNDPAFGRMTARLGEAVDALEEATAWLGEASAEQALAGATPYLRLFALALGGCLLANEALAADDGPDDRRRVGRARFFAENLATAAPGLANAVTEGADSVLDAAGAAR